MTVDEIKVEMAKLPAHDRLALVDWALDDSEVLESRRDWLRKEIQAGIDQLERGECAPLDMEAIKRRARSEWESQAVR